MYRSIGCPECGGMDTLTLSPYMNEHECGYCIQCMECGVEYEEPTTWEDEHEY